MLFVDPTLKRPKLASELFEALNQSDIVYCHWKSNERLFEGLIGETDLDLLVDRNSFAPIIALLLEAGFKQAAVRDGVAIPGVLHFYAFDEDAADLLHVHLYSQVVTGESLVKSHLLPCEAILLQNGRKIGEVRVPCVEAEAAVALLRAFLKKGSLIHSLIHGKLEGRAQHDERLFRADAVAADAAYRCLTKCCQAIERELFLECYRALAEGCSPARKWVLGLQVRRRLRGYARHTFAGRMKAYTGLILAKIRRKARGAVKNKVLQSGGAVIAFLGGDATGKSTLVTESARWLGSTFAVRTLHLGKPPHTWVTLPLRIVLPIARRLFPSQRHEARQSVHSATTSFTCDGEPASNSSLIYAIRALGLAWDRSRLVRKAHRAAGAGEIVICDRYPSGECGTMDGPRLQVHTDKRTWRTRMVNWIASCEQRLYRENPAPDIALRLHVSIETAKRRNRERPTADRHSDESVEVRHEPKRAWRKTGTKIVHEFDTEVSLAETILLVKKTIWESL